MSLWDKMKGLGLMQQDDEFDDDAYEDETEERVEQKPERPQKEQQPRVFRGESKKVVQYSGGAPSQMQVVLCKPERFDDVPAVADNLNEKKTVVLNLESANRDVARRILDFISGVAYANHGNLKKVANSTFIVTPDDVNVLGELMLDDFENSPYDWN